MVNVLAKRLKYCLEISGFPGTDDWATGPDLTAAGLPELPPSDAMEVIDENAADPDDDDDYLYPFDDDAASASLIPSVGRSYVRKRWTNS
jgi:hypothetical protein